VVSLAGAAVGVLEGATLGIQAIGNALAMAEGLKGKHAVKQADRLLGNQGICVWDLFSGWVPYAVGDRPGVVTALGWTDSDAGHHRAVDGHEPRTGHPAALKDGDEVRVEGVAQRARGCAPRALSRGPLVGVKVTVLADRGFGDQALYELLQDQLGLDFVVRFRGIVKVTSVDGETRPAASWAPKNGRPLRLRGARVTRAGHELGAVVCVKAKGMKEAWLLATSDGDRSGAEIVERCGKRFTIEESLRDQQSLRFGMGCSDTRMGNPDRRDRMLLISAVAISLLTILGAAGGGPSATTSGSRPARSRSAPSRCSGRAWCTATPSRR
jgi:hypothetical protein